MLRDISKIFVEACCKASSDLTSAPDILAHLGTKHHQHPEAKRRTLCMTCYANAVCNLPKNGIEIEIRNGGRTVFRVSALVRLQRA